MTHVSGVSTWYAGLVSVAFVIPVWATVLLALMLATTSGRTRRVVRVLFGWSPLWTWVLAAAVLAVAFSGWVPGGEVIGPATDAMGWLIVLIYGGLAGFLAWVVCLAWFVLSGRFEGVGRFLLGWPFWSIPPVVLAVAWWLANRRLGVPSTYAFWVAFGGTGAWVLSALWLGPLFLRGSGPSAADALTDREWSASEHGGNQWVL